jgi:hypothetical protein
VFNNCVFNISGDNYNLWTWSAKNVTLNNCTFNSDGKAILLYGGTDTKLEVNGCVFNDKGGLTDLKAAIEIGNDYDKSYQLIVNNTVVNGYEINDKGINTGTTLWGNKKQLWVTIKVAIPFALTYIIFTAFYKFKAISKKVFTALLAKGVSAAGRVTSISYPFNTRKLSSVNSLCVIKTS